jgi:phosphate transport system permease protein
MGASANPAASGEPYLSPPGKARGFAARLRGGDEVAHILTLLFAASVVLVTVLLVFELWMNSALPRRTFGWHFFVTSVWDPVFEHFGALPFLYGTIVTTIVALIIAVPLGVGAAIFLAELAPRRLSDALAFVIDLLAAVPSVIYGVLGIFVVVPFVRTVLGPFLESTLGFLPLFKGPTYGLGVLTASLVLTIMIVPFIISVSREVLMAVPVEQREAALGLGATRWESTIRIVVPFASTGIAGSIFLAMARALGETMAVTMVIGNDPKIAASLLAPGYTIAAVIANEFTEATGALYLQSLIELGLVLFLVTFILNGVARLLIVATERRGGAAIA